MFRSVVRACVLPILLFLSSGLWAAETVWIDVRSPEEYADGHVAQAVNIPYTEIGTRIAEVTEDKDAQIYLYCRSGRRAGIALDTLNEMGYVNVVNLDSLENARAKALEMSTK